MDPEEERRNIIEAINHLEQMMFAATDPNEIADYARQIAGWRRRLADLKM